jgi:hypothetical protein
MAVSFIGGGNQSTWRKPPIPLITNVAVCLSDLITLIDQHVKFHILKCKRADQLCCDEEVVAIVACDLVFVLSMIMLPLQ